VNADGGSCWGRMPGCQKCRVPCRKLKSWTLSFGIRNELRVWRVELQALSDVCKKSALEVGSAAPHGSHTNIMVALISLAREMQIARDSRLHSHGRWYNPVSEFMDFSLDSSSWNIVADCCVRFLRLQGDIELLVLLYSKAIPSCRFLQ